MCNPLMVTAGVTALQYFGGKAAAKQQYQATKESTLLGYKQNAIKQGQINDKSALEQSERIKQGMLERAKIATVAGESGSLGLSADRLISDSFFQEGTDMASMETNRQNEIAQASMEGQQMQGRGQVANSQIASREPTLLGTGLQIGSDAYGAYKDSKTKAKV